MKKIFGLLSLAVLLGAGSYAYAHVTTSLIPDPVAVGNSLTLTGVADIDNNGVFAAVLYSFYNGDTKVADGCVVAPANDYSVTPAVGDNHDVPFTVSLDTTGLALNTTHRLYWKPQASADCEEETVPNISKREDYATNVATLECRAGFHPVEVLVSPAIPAIEEESHIVYHEAVTEDVTTCEKVKDGMYTDKDCECLGEEVSKKKPKDTYDLVTKTVTVKEAWEEKVIDVVGVPGTPAVYETSCVSDEVTDPDPDPTPTPDPSRGGGGKCLNCDDNDPVEEEEEEEAPVDDEEEEETPAPVEQSCPALLKGFIKLGAANDPKDVFVLQNFLNTHENAGLKYTGFYSHADFNAVKAFQAKYYASVIAPWHTYLPGMNSTGYVYQTTRYQINKILCPEKAGLFPTLIP